MDSEQGRAREAQSPVPKSEGPGAPINGGTLGDEKPVLLCRLQASVSKDLRWVHGSTGFFAAYFFQESCGLELGMVSKIKKKTSL